MRDKDARGSCQNGVLAVKNVGQVCAQGLLLAVAVGMLIAVQ